MSKVGNQTNSNDPQAVNSRVFVGNLNTYQVSKEDVERLFKRYGRIGGISMHKGYAFVQYSNPYEARSAVSSEDGNVVCGQMLDVNMVAEPKLHQTGRKRQNLTNTGNDWDYYYDSYSVASHQQQQLQQQQQQQQRLTPPNKRARMGTLNNSQKQRMKSGKSSKSNGSSINNSIVVPTTVNSSSSKLSSSSSQQHSPPTTHHHYNNSSSSSSNYHRTSGDILICGNCKESFSGVQKMIDHKKTRCKLRFACRCRAIDDRKAAATNDSTDDPNEPSSYLCATCKDKFSSAWDLVHHVQSVHELSIYELPSSSDGNAGGGGGGSGVSGSAASGAGGGGGGNDEGGNSNASIKDEDDNAADELALDGSSCGTPEELETNEQY